MYATCATYLPNWLHTFKGSALWSLQNARDKSLKLFQSIIPFCQTQNDFTFNRSTLLKNKKFCRFDYFNLISTHFEGYFYNSKILQETRWQNDSKVKAYLISLVGVCAASSALNVIWPTSSLSSEVSGSAASSEAKWPAIWPHWVQLQFIDFLASTRRSSGV